MSGPEENETFDEALARIQSSTTLTFNTYEHDPILSFVNTPKEYSGPTIQSNELNKTGKYGFSDGDKFVKQNSIWRTSTEREKPLKGDDQFPISDSVWQEQSACELNAINQSYHSLCDTRAYKRKLPELIEISDDELPMSNNKRQRNCSNQPSPPHTPPHQTHTSDTPGYRLHVPSNGQRTSASWNRPGYQKTTARTPPGGLAKSSSRGDRISTSTSNQGYQNTNQSNPRNGLEIPSNRTNGCVTFSRHQGYQSMNPMTPQLGLGMSPTSIGERVDSSSRNLRPNIPSSRGFPRPGQSNPPHSSIHSQLGVNTAHSFEPYAHEVIHGEGTWQKSSAAPNRAKHNLAEFGSDTRSFNRYGAERYYASVPSDHQTSSPYIKQRHRTGNPSSLLTPNPNRAQNYTPGIIPTSQTLSQPKVPNYYTDTTLDADYSSQYKAQGYHPGAGSALHTSIQHGKQDYPPDVPFASYTLSPNEAQGYRPEVPPGSYNLNQYKEQECRPGNSPNSHAPKSHGLEDYDFIAPSIYSTSIPNQSKSYASGPFLNSRCDSDHSVQYVSCQNHLEQNIKASASSNGKEPATKQTTHKRREHSTAPYVYNDSKANTPLPSYNGPYSSGQGIVATSKRKHNDTMGNSGSEDDGMFWPLAKRQKSTPPSGPSATTVRSQTSQPRKRPVSLKIHQVAANAMKVLDHTKLLDESISGGTSVDKRVKIEKEVNSSPLIDDEEEEVNNETCAGWENVWEGVLDGSHIVNDDEVEVNHGETICSAQPVVHSLADISSGPNPSVTTLLLDRPSATDLPAANPPAMNTAAVNPPQEATSEDLPLKRTEFVPDGRRDFRYVEPLSGQEQASITLAIECTRSDYLHLTGEEPPKTSSEESYAKQYGELQEALEAHWKGPGQCPNLMCVQPWRADFGEKDLPEFGLWDDQSKQFDMVCDGIDLSEAAFEYYMNPFDGDTLFGLGTRVSDRDDKSSGTESVPGRDDATAGILDPTDVQHFDTVADGKLLDDDKNSDDANSTFGEEIPAAHNEHEPKPVESQNIESHIEYRGVSADPTDNSFNQLPTFEELTGRSSYEEFLSDEFVPRTEEKIRAMYPL